MRTNLLMCSLLLLLLIAVKITDAQAQNSNPVVVASAGATNSGTSMQIDWTVGEVAITTIQNSSHQITQGFHQPNYRVTSADELPVEIGVIKVFPNPSADWLEINLNFNQHHEVRMQLWGLNGQLIWTKRNQGQTIQERANMVDLPNGNYFLKILIDSRRFSQTFKIQRLN